MMDKERGGRNRTLQCSESEIERLSKTLGKLCSASGIEALCDRIYQQDALKALPLLPRKSVDLVILDPPYNRSRDYHGHPFKRKREEEYYDWFSSMLSLLLPVMKATGTLYVCSDWKTSHIIGPLLHQRLNVRNRITWEREKGRGAKANWKNSAEDIWFCTLSEDYYFDVDAVKLKRKVLAPYRDAEGKPKDWEVRPDGNYRLTHPSNLWNDITIPFWSMPENTDHPTQKPEKLIAKLVLASSAPGDVVLDPFLGSGTTAAVCQKLGRRYVGIEQNKEYCCWALKRLASANSDPSIQGYAEGVFWERNTSIGRSPLPSPTGLEGRTD